MITIEGLVEQAKDLCEGFCGFECLDDELVPMCKLSDHDVKERVCVSGYMHCYASSTFDTRIKSIQRLASLATKLHKKEVKQ